MTGQSGVLYVQTKFFSKGRPGKPRVVVIHGTSSGRNYSAQDTARDFATNRGASTHYVVGYDGTIVQCCDENDTAWGNGDITGPAGNAPVGGGNTSAPHDSFWDTTFKRDANGYSISIEHSKDVGNNNSLSDAQKAASFLLIHGICSRWNIPLQYATANGGVTGHYSVDPIRRAFCPGPYPWAELFKSGGSLPPPAIDQYASVASSAGFSGQSLAIILAIAHAESGENPANHHTNSDGSIDRGILQINNRWHPEVSDSCAYDPSCAFKAAFTISKSGTDFTPWSTFVNGAYKQFLSGVLNPPLGGGGGNLPLSTTPTPFKPMYEAAHLALVNVPGFQGITEALDIAERFTPFEMQTSSSDITILGNDTGISNPIKLSADAIQATFQFLVANFNPFCLRFFISGAGIFILFCLLLNLLQIKPETVSKLIAGAATL